MCVYLGGGGALFVFYFLAYFSSFALSVSVVKGLGGWHCTHYVWVNSRFRVENIDSTEAAVCLSTGLSVLMCWICCLRCLCDFGKYQ